MTASATTHVWLLEDDEACRDVVLETLRDRWAVRWFCSFADFERAVREAGPEAADVGLVIADVCLPDGNFVRWLASEPARGLLDRVPFLVVSSLDDPEVVRTAFREGAIDFLSKPFGRAELIVKVERFLAGAPPSRPAAPFELDASTMVLRRTDGAAVGLTAKEMQILTLLWNAPSHAMTRDELNAIVWSGCHVGRKTLDVHLSRLRRKLTGFHVDVRALAPNRVVLVHDDDGEPPA